MFGFKKKEETPVVKQEVPKYEYTAENIEKDIHKYMDYTTHWATREAHEDLIKIESAFQALQIPYEISDFEAGLKYLFYITPRHLEDYQKLLTTKAYNIFCAAYGTRDIRIYWEGSYIVLEVPGAPDNPVRCADVLLNQTYLNSDSLTIGLGLKPDMTPILINLEDAPHILIGGETGSGKSILLHDIIVSLLLNHTPDELQLYLVDTKRVEFNKYTPLKNVNVYFDVNSCMNMLQMLCNEMDRRYNTISRSGCRDIESYNAKYPTNKMSRKVVVIDELSDLMSRGLKKDTENLIVRLAQLARACGIHLIIATQRPDRNVVTGLIKDNIPTRICMSVSSGVNSRIILDRMGGEKLTGKGDMLVLENGARDTIRCQAGYIREQEINNVVYTVYNRR